MHGHLKVKYWTLWHSAIHSMQLRMMHNTWKARGCNEMKMSASTYMKQDSPVYKRNHGNYFITKCKKWRHFSNQRYPISEKKTPTFGRFADFARLSFRRATSRWRWVWVIGGIILIGRNRRTRRKVDPNAILFIINLTRTDQGSNPCLRGERPATNCLSHRTA